MLVIITLLVSLFIVFHLIVPKVAETTTQQQDGQSRGESASCDDRSAEEDEKHDAANAEERETNDDATVQVEYCGS